MTTEPRIFPSHCHVLSETFKDWVPIRIADLLALKEVEGFEGQGIYFYLNHPIKWVRLTGAIVAIDHFSNRVSYTLDDFSGHTIECVCKAPLKPEPPKLDSPDASKAAAKAAEINDPMISPDGPKLKGIDVCSIVKIKGAISVFRDVRQIAMKRIHVISDTAAEVAEWKKRSAFMRDVLRVPWVVTEEQEKKCLRNAEREKWKEEERKKRKIKEGETAEERKVRKRREKAAKREKEKVRVEEEKKQMVVDERKEREVWLREQTLMRERRKRELERRRAAM